MSSLPLVVVVCPYCSGTGAVANVAIHQARELSNRFRVTVISQNFPRDEIRGITPLLIKPLRFGFMRRFSHVPNQLAFALAAKRAIARLHAENPVDFIICHGHPVATLAARSLQRKLGIRYGLVTHGDIFDRPKGTYDSRLTWFYQRTTRPAYRDADLVVALSPYMARLAIQGGAKSERVVLIPNGIDIAEITTGKIIQPDALQEKDCLKILYVGRLSVEKGVDILLNAAAILARRSVDFRLKIAGAGPMAQSLKQMTTQLLLDESIEFLGQVSRPQLGNMYIASDVLCIPSRSESFGNVALEASAAGITVVGSDVGGISFIIEHGVTGLLFPADDANALAAALEKFCHDKSLARRMGREAQRRVAREFSWPKIGKLLCNAINTALALDDKKQ